MVCRLLVAVPVWAVSLAFSWAQLVAGTSPPEVSIRRPSDSRTYGPKDIVFVLYLPSRPEEESLDGKGLYGSWWGYPAMANVALQAFREQAVLNLPEGWAWSGHNFHILFADTCPGPGTDCTEFYAMDIVMQHFLLNENHNHPYPKIAIGGGHKGLPISQVLSALRVPTFGHWMDQDDLDIKEEYPYFARANPPSARKFQAIVQVMQVMGYTRGVLWHGSSSHHAEMRAVVLREARETSITISTISITDGPSEFEPPSSVEGTPGFAKHEEWTNAWNAARVYGSHFQILAFTPAMPYLELISWLNLQGLIGSGFLWISEIPLLAEYTAYQAAIASHAPYSPYLGLMPAEGMLSLITLRTANETGKLKDYVRSLENRTDAIEPWIREQLDPEWWKNPLTFPDDPQILFDAVWTALMATSMLLVEHGSQDFSSDALKSRMVNVSFDGASGHIQYDGVYSRKAEGPLVQVQKHCGAEQPGDPREVRVGQWSSADNYGADVQLSQVLMKFHNCSLEKPPDLPLACSSGYYYNQTRGVCSICPMGTARYNQSECSPCQAGTFSGMEGQSTCAACTAGHFTSMAGATACKECQAGRFQEEVQSLDCRSCQSGRFSAKTGVTSCEQCPRGNYSSEEAATMCMSCEGRLSTSHTGSEGADDCVCQLGMVRRNVSEPCTDCGNGLVCSFGSSLAQWFDPDPDSKEVYPRILPGFWADANDPVNVFSCESAYRCPGGDPGSCGPGLPGGGRACAHCPSNRYWNGRECRECKIQDASRTFFPWVPMCVTPIAILLLYSSNGGHGDWRSWTRSVVTYGFVLLNHVQVVSLLSQANVELPRRTEDMGDAWAWTLDWLAIFKLECAGYKDIGYKMLFQTTAPMFLVLWGLMLYLCSNLLAIVLNKPNIGMHAARAFDVLMGIIFSFFVAIVAMSLRLYKCQDNPNGTSSLKADLSVLCYDDQEWVNMLGLALAAVGIYCVGCGGLFVWATVQAVHRFADENFRAAWKFLFIRYRMDTWWWSLSFLAKGVLLNLCLVWSKDGLHQLYLMMGVAMVYTLAVVTFMPYRVWFANHLEVLSGFSALFIGTIMSNFVPKYTVNEDSTSDMHGGDRGAHLYEDELDLFGVWIAWSPAMVALVMGGIVIYRQLLKHWSGVKGVTPAREALIRRLQEASMVITHLTDEDVADLLTSIDEPDRRAIHQALSIIESEVMGLSHWRLNARKVCIQKMVEQRASVKRSVSKLQDVLPDAEGNKAEEVLDGTEVMHCKALKRGNTEVFMQVTTCASGKMLESTDSVSVAADSVSLKEVMPEVVDDDSDDDSSHGNNGEEKTSNTTKKRAPAARVSHL